MSDPVSNAEIEDVLSSIRRLVSNGDREQSPVSSDAKRDPAGKLVLTPALRVDASRDDDDGESHHAEHDSDLAASGDRFEFHHVPHEDEATSDGQPQDAMLLKEDDAVQAEDAASPDMPDAETPSEHEAEPEQYDTAQSWEDPAPRDQSFDNDEPDAAQDASEQSPEPRSQDEEDESEKVILGDRIAEVEAAVAAREEEWEPDGESDDPYVGSEVTPMEWVDEVPEAEHDASAPFIKGPSLVYANPGSDPAGADDRAASEDGDVAASSDGATGREVGSHRAEEDDAALWADDGDAIIDEETLRDMVSEIVRQELQGALGERITRNVRKLVRREIHRALTSQEFD